MLPIWITTLPKIKNWSYHYNDLVSQFQVQLADKSWEKSGARNFRVDVNHEVWYNLYQQFLKKAQQFFGEIKLLDDNITSVWCYGTNKDYYKAGIHDHKTTSVINAVYYFSVPETKEYRDGAIAFYDNSGKEIWCYKPRECDLLIFPNYLKHQPLPTISSMYRFALNMEIICEPFGQFKAREY